MIKKIVIIIFSIPKSLVFNIKLFGIKKGIKIPILIKYNTIIKNCRRGSIELCNNKFASIKIGINHGTFGISEEKKVSLIYIDNQSKIIFKGRADFKEGISILATYGGIINFGDNFSSNRNCFISSDKTILFGDEVVLGWNVHIRTSDGHEIYMKNNHDTIINPSKSVQIGNHVWIGANATVLKGVKIGDNNVVGFNSCVTKSYVCENCIIAGYPAKIIKENIDWIH